MKRLRLIALLPLFALLGGCNLVVLDPAGDVAAQQRDLLIESTGLMLLIIVPVIALTCCSPGAIANPTRLRLTQPDWDHSTQLELVIWGAPLLIIICLGAMTWMGTHLLDPYRPLDAPRAGKIARAARKRAASKSTSSRSTGNGCSSTRNTASPRSISSPRRSNRTIDFRITSSSVMNSFSIPALAGQIYAMPGMETTLYAVMNETGRPMTASRPITAAPASPACTFAFQSLEQRRFRHMGRAGESGRRLARPQRLSRSSNSRARTSRRAAMPASIRSLQRDRQ